MKKTMWIAAAAALLLPSALRAQPGPGREGVGHPLMGGLIQAVNRLDLTDSQRGDVHRIMEDAESRLLMLAEPGEERPGFTEYFCSAEFSSAGLEALLNQRLEKMRQANAIVAGALGDVRALLTQEQIDELSRMFQERHREAGPHGGGPHRWGSN